MTYFQQLLSNTVLIASIVSWASTQILKMIIDAAVNKRLDLTRLFGDGGFPSGHSATVTTLALCCANIYGLGSFAFAATAILAVIVMHDAMGVRLETGKQARVINEIMAILSVFEPGKEGKKPIFSEEKMKELVGHTPLQVFAGFFWGCLVAIFFWS